MSAATAAEAACAVDAQPVNFGVHQPLTTDHHDGTGLVSVTCDASASFSVHLSAGGGTVDDRRMNSGSDVMRYNLYSNAARTLIWGDLADGRGPSFTGKTANLPIYGRIPGGQNVDAGSYSDIVVVTVQY
ncbi:MAG TPA: spore coat U domain-containing protein [Caulobacteraceae bacterium]|nr:spore coat U domain-containing protein [Caulobacteraceae bacterium]